jgi:tRNA (cytidine/uridine-2'-O-)-methyltransferase
LDYWKNVELKLWENIDDFFNSVPIEKMHLFSKRGSIRYDKASYKKGDFLIFGRETKGIPKEFLEKYSQRVRVLPMPGKLVRSLNLAVTAGVVLFEALRQNDFFENLE